MKNRQSSAQHSQKIRQRMNSESYGLSKFPVIKNNRLISGRPAPKQRPFSCLPGPDGKTRPQSILDRIPSTMVRRKMKLHRKPLGMEHIIHQNTVIRGTMPVKARKKLELDLDIPIDFMLYDKKDPVLRDIFNGVRHNKIKKGRRQSAFRIKTQGGFKVKRRPGSQAGAGKKGALPPFVLHRQAKKENDPHAGNLRPRVRDETGERGMKHEEKGEGALANEELFNKDEMTRCALKYLPPEMKLFDEEALYKEDSKSFKDIFNACNKQFRLAKRGKDLEPEPEPNRNLSRGFLEENMLFSSVEPKKKIKKRKKGRLEKDLESFVNKKLKVIKDKSKFGREEKSVARQHLAISKMKQRQSEEEEFKTPSERIGRYMQFSSVLQKEHLLEVLDLIEGVSKKEKKDGEIPIQLVCWNEHIGLDRVQRVGAAYYEDIQTLLKRNCFMVYPEFLDPSLKRELIEQKIINKIDFRDRLRPTEDYYKWLLSRSRNTYDPIFLSRLAVDPPPIAKLPAEVGKLIQESTKRYQALIGEHSPVAATELSPYQRSWIERVLSKVDAFYVETYSQDFRDLWREIFDQYITVGRQIIVDYALRYHRERRRWGIHLLRRPKLSFAQKIFESGGYHRQFHDRWHRLFENSKRFMTKEFFGINGLSLALHEWFQGFSHLSLTELRLTKALGHLDRTLSPKEFFLFQEFNRKMVLGFINQVLIRGAYFLIKKRKLFCREEQLKQRWTLGGCGPQDHRLSVTSLGLDEIHFLSGKVLKKKKDRSDYDDVINMLRVLQHRDQEGQEERLGFRELMLGTKLADLPRVRMESPGVDLNARKFGFPEQGANWNNHLYIREDFKMRVLNGVKENQSKEEFLAEEKLEKTLGILMGLRLRDILARSVEDVLDFFESFAKEPAKHISTLLGPPICAKTMKRIEKETFTPIFKIELVVDNGVLKLGEVQKKLIEELNSFFLGLCQSLKSVSKPKFIKIEFVKNAFEKKFAKTKEDDVASEEVVVDTVLDCKNLEELSLKKEIKLVNEVNRKLSNFKAETNFDDLFSNYLSEVKVEPTARRKDQEESSTLPFVGNIFQTYRDRIEHVIQLVVSNLIQSKNVLQKYYEFQNVFSGKFKEEVQGLKFSSDLKKILEFYKKIRRLDAVLENLPASCFFKMFEVSLEKVNNILRTKLSEEKNNLESRVECILSSQGQELTVKYKNIESRIRGQTEVYTELHTLETYLGKLDKELVSLVQRSQVFFKKVALIFKEKIFRERRVSLINICKELREFPRRIRAEKLLSENRLKESRKRMILDLNFRINTFQLEVQKVISEFAKLENRTLVFEDCRNYKVTIKTSQQNFAKIKKEHEEILKQFEILHKKKYEEHVLFKFCLKAEPYYCLWSVCFEFMEFRKQMIQQDIKKLLGIDLEGKRSFIQLRLAEFQETFLKSFSLIHSDVNIENPVPEKGEQLGPTRETDLDSQKKSLLVLKENNVNSLMKLKGSLEEEILRFEQYVPLLEILIKTELEERHWKVIQRQADKEFDVEELYIINISKYLEKVDIDVVRQVAKKARKEKKIDLILSQTLAKFEELRLGVDESDVKKRFDILQLEHIEYVLEEESIRLDRVINLRKEKYQKASLLDLRRLLKKSLELVKIIKETQVLLDELKVVFEGEEIRNSLGSTWKKFEVEEREFRESLRAVEISGSLETVIKTEGNPILGLFQKLNGELRQIKEGVWNYLQSKRLSFPRFFCLDDQELFSLLKDYGSDTGIDTIEKHLPKMFLTVNTFLKNNQKKNIICGVGDDPWKGREMGRQSRDYAERKYLLSAQSLTQTVQTNEEIKFHEEIEVQRFILEELMSKIEQNIEEQVTRGVKSQLNAYMRLTATGADKKMNDLQNWVLQSTSQEVFICFSIILAKKLRTFKGHSKDFSAFETHLNTHIEFFASLYTNRNNGTQPISPKFLYLICFFSRIRELFASKKAENTFLRELMISFEIEKNGQQDSKFADDDEDSDKKSYEEFPEWKLRVGNSFFSIDFGGEFVSNMNTLDLLPQNEKSFISLFSTLHKQKIGLFSQSHRFWETLHSLTRFTGYFLRFAEMGPHHSSAKLVTSLTQSAFLGGFWCGLDFSSVEDYEFLSEVNVQLVIITFLQYYQEDAKATNGGRNARVPNFAPAQNSQTFSLDAGKKQMEEFLSQFKILPLNPSIQALENKLKPKFFLNCSKNNLKFFKLSLKDVWRNVTSFKAPSSAFFEKLLYLKGVEDIAKIRGILDKFWDKCKMLSIPIMTNFENPRIIWKLVLLIEAENKKNVGARFKAKNILSIFQDLFVFFVPISHHHQLISILKNLFENYLPRKKYSLRPRLHVSANPFADTIRLFLGSVSVLLEYSSAILITGKCPPFLPSLLVRVLEQKNSLAFNFSCKGSDQQDFFGADCQTPAPVSNLFMNSQESVRLRSSPSSTFTKRNASKSFESKQQSSQLTNINFKSRPRNSDSSQGFYSQLFRCFEHFDLHGGSLLSALKKFGIFSYNESLNFRLKAQIAKLEALLFKSEFKLSIQKSKAIKTALKKAGSSSEFTSESFSTKDYDSVSLVMDSLPTSAPILFSSSQCGSYVHSDGAVSNFADSRLNCIFQSAFPVELPPSFLGKISIVHFQYQDSFVFLQSAFQFHLDLMKTALPSRFPLESPPPQSLAIFFRALARLFVLLFERLLLIQKKNSNISRLSAFINFLSLLDQSLPAFLSENTDLLQTESSLIISRCVLGFFLQTANFSINVSPDQKIRKSFNRHLKSLLDSFFNHNISAKYPLPFDRTLLKGMSRFNLDLFYFRDTSWHLLPPFFNLHSPEKPLPSFSQSVNPIGQLLSRKTLTAQSSSKMSMDINDSIFMLSPDHDYSNYVSQSSNVTGFQPFVPISGQLRYLQNLLQFSTALTLRYHPRFPLPEVLEMLLNFQALSDPPTPSGRSLLKVSPLQNITQAFLRNMLLGSYIPVDPITLKHPKASNLSDLSFTVMIHDVSLNSPSQFSFWNRLTSTGEVQNLSSSPFSICTLHNTQLLCLSPFEANKPLVSEPSLALVNSPYVTVPNFRVEQLTQIFTMFVDPLVPLTTEGLILLTKSPTLSPFVLEFSETLAPFLADLYFSPYLKDNFHFSVSDPKIFSIFRNLCLKINHARKASESFNSGSIVSIFQQVFRQSNIIQESAATILYNSSVFLFKSVSSQSSKNILSNSQIAQAVNDLSKNVLYKHFFRHISFGNYSNEIIEQIADLSEASWIYSGHNYLMKLQHLLISAHNFSFKVMNPETPIASCAQLKHVVCSVFEEVLRNRVSCKMVLLLDLRPTGGTQDVQMLLHIVLNKQFSLIFSKREVKDYAKRLCKSRRSHARKSRFRGAPEVSLITIFDNFLSAAVSFCLWEFDMEFEEKRRLFRSFPRVDMRSFSEFIETNFIKNKIFSCSELFTFLKGIQLPLINTTALDFFNRFLENLNFFWKNKYGESDLDILFTLIRNVEFSMLRISEERRSLKIFWDKIGDADAHSEELLKHGQASILKLEGEVGEIEEELHQRQRVCADKSRELEQASEEFRQMLQRSRVETEELELLRETEQNIFGTLKESFALQKKNLSKLKLENILEMFVKNRENKSVDFIAKVLCLLFWTKSTSKVLTSGKLVISWVDTLQKKAKGVFAAKFREVLETSFSKKLTSMIISHVLSDKALQKKMSAQLLPLRMMRTLLTIKASIEVKIQKNKKFITSLTRQKEICESFTQQLELCEQRLGHIQQEHSQLTLQIDASLASLKSKTREIDHLKHKLSNSQVYSTSSRMEQAWDPRIVKPEIIFLDSLMTGVYFTLGYQMMNNPMLLNGIKNMISFNCDQFLLEEALNLLKERPLIKLFCKTTRIEKLFWGNYIFGIETLSKFQRIHQCKLKFFVIRDPFEMCLSLVKEVGFKKDIVVVRNIRDLCLSDLQTAITEGKLFLLVNVRLSDAQTDTCDCQRCRNVTRFEGDKGQNQNAVNHLLALVSNPAQYIKKIYDKIEKESLNFLKQTEDFSRSAQFQLIVFTKDNFEDFNANALFREHCLFEEFLETRSDLEGKLGLLFMELLNPKMHQNYLLNCREILKNIKKKKQFQKDLQGIVCSLETALIEDSAGLGKFVTLRAGLNKCKRMLTSLKQKNVAIMKTMRRDHNQYIVKIIYMWRLVLLICEYKKLRRMTIQDVLGNLRKSIDSAGGINLKKLSRFFFDTVQFSLDVSDRELLGTLLILLIENSNLDVSLKQVIDLAFLGKKERNSREHPLLDLNKEIFINKETLLDGVFNLYDNQNSHGNQNSLIFDHLIIKNLQGTSQIEVSDTSNVTTLPSNLDEPVELSHSKDDLFEGPSLVKVDDPSHFNCTLFSKKQIGRLLKLERTIHNFRGLMTEIMKIENNFHEKFYDNTKPIWRFAFQLNQRQVGPLEMLLILKNLNFEKYLVDMGIFVQWYYSFLIFDDQKKGEKEEEKEDSDKLFRFNNFTPQELESLKVFSARNYNENTKNFYMMKNLEQHLVQNVKQGKAVNYKHFIEAQPSDGLIYLKSLAGKRNVVFNYFYFFSKSQVSQLLLRLQESKENNEWLFIELSFYSEEVFKKLNHFIHSLENTQNSLHSFQVFIISPPNLRIFDLIPMKYRESLKYYRLRVDFPLSFTISKFLLCFENILELDCVLPHFQFEEFIRRMMHSSPGDDLQRLEAKAGPAPGMITSPKALHKDRNRFLIKILLSMSYSLTKKTLSLGSLSQQMYYQDVIHYITDSIVAVYCAHQTTEEILREGEDFRVRQLLKNKLEQLKLVLKSFLVTDYDKDSECLERINELLISEFDSLRFSNELSVGIKNLVEDVIVDSGGFQRVVQRVYLAVCPLVRSSNKAEISGLLDLDGIAQIKSSMVARFHFQRFAETVEKNFGMECRRDQVKYEFYVQTQFDDRDNKLQIDYRSVHNSELFTRKCFEDMTSLSKIPNLVLNLWRFSYLSVEQFRTKIRSVIINELLSRIPKKINIELVEIKYKILKKDPLDELFIAEYYHFNKNILALRTLLHNSLVQVHSGFNSTAVKCLMNDRIPPSWRSSVQCAAFMADMTDLLFFLAEQRTYFLMVIELNYKYLFDLKFFRFPRKTLQVAKQVISKRIRKVEETLKEEYKIYDTEELDALVRMDIDNGVRDGYFIKGLFLVGCRLHYVDQKLTEDGLGGKGLFSRAPLLMVRLVPHEETPQNFLVKFHSLPVYRCLPQTLNLCADPIAPSLKNPQVCIQCLQFFCNNVQYFNIKDENFMKLIYELRGRLSSKSCFNFYRLQDIPPAFSKILVNMNQICVHREAIPKLQMGDGVGIVSTDDFNDYLLLSLRFPTIEKENHWIKKMAYAVLTLPAFFRGQLA